mgnify:CR=1 FL=1
MEKFASPFANVTLERLPLSQQQSNLRAWDAANELLLAHLNEQSTLSANTSILLINDSFAALACSLNQFNCSSWSDSIISHQAINHNFQLNKLDHRPEMHSSMEAPPHSYNVVLIKLPKSNALLEQQLIDLHSSINSETIIIAAGMVKYITKNQIELFNKYIGPTTTSLAKKKARLIFSKPDIKSKPSSPYPTVIDIDELQLRMSNYANVFSREKLDIGSRFFIENFKQLPTAKTIIDLGCGNGLLGIIAQRLQSQAKITFADESYMAVASAERNYYDNIPTANNENSPNFIASDCLSQIEATGIDLILCNPPFHQNNTVGDHIAREMFKQSHQKLRQGGELWIVGNRHLNYHISLKRVFTNCRTVASNKKFVVLAATKR